MKLSSKYTIVFTTIDGKAHKYTWEGVPLTCYQLACRPHAPHGINFKDERAWVTIPWHEIKESSFTEELIDEDEKGAVPNATI